MVPGFNHWQEQLRAAAESKKRAEAARKDLAAKAATEPKDDLARRFDSLADCVRLILDGKQLELQYLAELEGRIRQLEGRDQTRPEPQTDERLLPVLEVLRAAGENKFVVVSPGAARLLLEAIEGKR